MILEFLKPKMRLSCSHAHLLYHQAFKPLFNMLLKHGTIDKSGQIWAQLLTKDGKISNFFFRKAAKA